MGAARRRVSQATRVRLVALIKRSRCSQSVAGGLPRPAGLLVALLDTLTYSISVMSIYAPSFMNVWRFTRPQNTTHVWSCVCGDFLGMADWPTESTAGAADDPIESKPARRSGQSQTMGVWEALACWLAVFLVVNIQPKWRREVTKRQLDKLTETRWRGGISKSWFAYLFFLFFLLPSPVWNEAAGLVWGGHEEESIEMVDFELDEQVLCVHSDKQLYTAKIVEV